MRFHAGILTTFIGCHTRFGANGTSCRLDPCNCGSDSILSETPGIDKLTDNDIGDILVVFPIFSKKCQIFGNSDSLSFG